MKTGNNTPKHIVLVRHGQSEGDVRRAARKQADPSRHPRSEEQTRLGHEQSRAAGLWVTKFILQAYGINHFDVYLTSPLIRTKQSAQSMGLSSSWKDDTRISERDRGSIQGMTKKQHAELHPGSYQQMQDHPFHWTPPDGESLLRVSSRITELMAELKMTHNTVLIMTHRDVMWAAYMAIDDHNIQQIESINTDEIGNAHIFHYTNLNPNDSSLHESIKWKRSIDPLGPDSWNQNSTWTELPTTSMAAQAIRL